MSEDTTMRSSLAFQLPGRSTFCAPAGSSVVAAPPVAATISMEAPPALYAEVKFVKSSRALSGENEGFCMLPVPMIATAVRVPGAPGQAAAGRIASTAASRVVDPASALASGKGTPDSGGDAPDSDAAAP